MTILNAIIRLLTFRMKQDELLNFTRKHFIAGLAGTWLAGIGRYWDDSHATILQHLGLGSVIYIFVLSLFIWLIVKPFNISNWNYFTVLTFISLTSFPAILYAIPVERFSSISTANSLNFWFLLVVASWRLALLYYFFKRFTQLGTGNILTITLMPMCIIISTLTILNLHHVVFEMMGGIRNPGPHDTSYLVLTLLTGLSAILAIPLLIAYVVGIYNRRN